jgi:hypothetical protein
MAVHEIERDALIKMLGIDLTDEQIASIKKDKFKIKVKDQDLTFDEIQVKYKKELDALKAKVVKERFKNQKPKADEPKEDEVKKLDIEELKREIYNEASKTIKVNYFIESLDEDDRDDAKAIIDYKIANGKIIADAIKETSARFKKEAPKEKEVVKRELNEFGMTTQKVNDNQADELQYEMQKIVKEI